jgi:arylsulfatase A-like enzyme
LLLPIEVVHHGLFAAPRMRRLVAIILGFTLALAVFALLVSRARQSGEKGTALPLLVRLEPVGSKAELLGDGAATRRRGFRADVPSIHSWTVRVPLKARLETQVSFARRTLDELAQTACRVMLSVVGSGGNPATALDSAIFPDSAWQLLGASLEAWGGQQVTLNLSVSCVSGEGKRTWPDAVRWSVPVLYGARPAGRPNVLLITVDTLRSDHLHAYGYARQTSPNLDRLAARGLLFTAAETVQSATWPSLTSLQTSLYPGSHGVVWNGHDMPGGIVTLAELLQATGYSTAAFLANMKRARHPGFSLVFTPHESEQSGDDRAATEAAIAELRLERERPFFLWLHLISPHASYDPPAPWDTAFSQAPSHVTGAIDELVRIREKRIPLSEKDVAHVVGLYDGEVAFADHLMGRVLTAVQDLGLESETLIVFTADHGEDLLEHNRYFFHSPSMYGSSLRVPLVLALPGVLPTGETTDQPASLVDLAPTVLGLLDLAPPAAFQGENLLPGKRLPARPVRSRLFSETNGAIFGVSAGGWRLIVNPLGRDPGAPGGPYHIAPVELYDLEQDPGERHDVAARRTDIVSALRGEIERWKSRYRRREPGPQTIDPSTLEELRALGYVFD